MNLENKITIPCEQVKCSELAKTTCGVYPFTVIEKPKVRAACPSVLEHQT